MAKQTDIETWQELFCFVFYIAAFLSLFFFFELRECHNDTHRETAAPHSWTPNVTPGKTGSGLASCVIASLSIFIFSCARARASMYCALLSCFHLWVVQYRALLGKHVYSFLLNKAMLHPTPTCRITVESVQTRSSDSYQTRSSDSYRIKSSPSLSSSATMEIYRFLFGSLSRRWTDLLVKVATSSYTTSALNPVLRPVTNNSSNTAVGSARQSYHTRPRNEAALVHKSHAGLLHLIHFRCCARHCSQS